MIFYVLLVTTIVCNYYNSLYFKLHYVNLVNKRKWWWIGDTRSYCMVI